MPLAALLFLAICVVSFGIVAASFWCGERIDARREQRGTFPEAYYDRDGRFRARGAYPLTPMPPESPAQRQLREWQERLDARHPPAERAPTPVPAPPVPAPQYTPPDSPPGMARRAAR